MGLSWVVDFDTKTLTGDVLLAVERPDPEAPLRLDTRDLDIRHAYAGTLSLTPGPQGVPELSRASARQDPALTETKWRFEDDPDQSTGDLGRALVVELPPGANVVKLTYATRPAATGLQWLDPAQTAGKTQPFLYSQSQAIHARSWIPCQDSPGVRTTWDAEVVVDGPRAAVMAAEQLGPDPLPGSEGAAGAEADSRTWRFAMPQRVPSYLIAIGVGDLERRELGDRSAVWADPTVVEAAANEFTDIEAMISSAEALYGDYAWGRYDVLVLPPAFPFGGMENPRLTFATPTILAGDRSLVSLIAHELAHSWSGNLVTNATWGDLWLNEGFTVYFERRIVEAIYGREQAEIEAVIGKRELLAELSDPEGLAKHPEYQRLDADLVGVDPDDYFSGVPYEKGYLLLRTLEEAYGRPVFDAFLRKWFDEHAFGSVATEDFLDYASRDLIAAHPVLGGGVEPDLAQWVSGAGLPESAPEPVAPILDEVAATARAFAAGELTAKEVQPKPGKPGKPAKAGQTGQRERWSPWLWLHFLRELPDTVSAEQLAALDERFALTDSTNAEILGQWLVLAANKRYEPAYARMEEFLIQVGRRKFLTPIYRALVTSEEGKTQAKAIYAKARPGYHAISRNTIDGIVGVD
nr:M1 family metallopeptidase [Pseudenhygromyxa sp. WMMC2535]